MKRKGSALLIVLGVLSFLVVSAVAFSAFMRRARQPSSYLRRVVASRQLAKAAIARAIDEIDHAIADDVHPGVGNGQMRTWQEGRVTRNAMNTWRDRVFFKENREADARDTTPTLTLEGLAYIPPPLVNEARYWARRSPTAEWQNIPYDIGRFAYCAIDVSDYFDVNRLVADYPRSSAANRRVTIAHLFEDVNHRQAPNGADAWDKFMEQFREIDKNTLEINFESGSKIPLVSLADFNLALGSKGTVGTLKSPFAEYIKNAGTSFYPGNSGAELDMYGSMTFVTDGWFPKMKKTSSDGKETTTYDLSDARNQPFQMASLQKDRMKLSQAFLGTGLNSQNGAARDLWTSSLGGLGCVALADYLDADRTPLSLAVPTTERVPMICGVSPQLGQAKFKLICTGKDGDPTIKQEEKLTRTVEQTVSWKIDGGELSRAFAQGRVQALAVYPFLHKEDNEPTFEIDGQFSLFFSSTDMRLRTGQNDVLHLAQNQIQQSAVDPGTGIIRVKLPTGNPAMKTLSQGEAETQEDAVWDSATALMLSDGSRIATDLGGAGKEFLKVVFTWKQTRDDEKSQEWTPDISEIMENPSKAEDVQASCGLPALKADGTVDTDFTSSLANNIKQAGWKKEIKLNAAVWLRVINKKDGKVVDMVPACTRDDRIQNPGTGDSDERAQIVLEGEGVRYPLMRFDTGVTLSFGIKELATFSDDAGTDIAIEPKAAMIGDPRFNYAPEHWFRHDSQNLSAQEWTNMLKTDGYIGAGEHDGDIFLATSDAGYLQSIYELAFLPRFTNISTSGGDAILGKYQQPGSGNLQTFPDKGSERNKHLMWASYDPIDMDEQAFEDLPFTSEGTGMKVNPYSNSTNVLMAAFANTPVDWRHASTNFMDGATEDYAAMDVKSFNQKYAWNDYSTGGAFAWEDLKKVAGKFMDRVRASGNSGWKSVWNDLGWYGGGDEEFLDMKMTGDTDKLWEADRKFLYGFWRDCFDAKQQLFLIFVRAEPLLLGGGTADQLPPQLGARAVALVWRDPATSTSGTENGYPHRTRLLFYKPLD